MRVAALYDIHGNLPALEAVLAEVREAGVDRIVLGGDVVAGPMPRATLDRLLALGDRVTGIRGNADREVVARFDGAGTGGMSAAAIEAADWAARQIDRRQRDWLAALPPTLVLAIDGLGPVLFCHGSPRSDEEIFTAAMPDERLRPTLAGVAQPLVVCGHTHMQFDRTVDNTRVVNAGSVGMPYGPPGAYWALLGPDVLLMHTAYDLDLAATLIRQSGYPQSAEFAQHNVLAPPTAEEATAVFERMAAERRDRET
jgi:predicted phosphodiesterase